MGSVEDNSKTFEADVPSFNLPIIDFANWKADSSPEERYEIGRKLADACHNVGFVYIINHGGENAGTSSRWTSSASWILISWPGEGFSSHQ
jgi:hypothetical protein